MQEKTNHLKYQGSLRQKPTLSRLLENNLSKFALVGGLILSGLLQIQKYKIGKIA